MSREPKPLSAKRAMERMRTGSRLVHMHDGKVRGRHWFVVPGGTVTDDVANVIKSHTSVIGGKDGLFPQHDQTWRTESFAQLAP